MAQANTNLPFNAFSIASVGARLLLAYIDMPLLCGVRLETFRYKETLPSKVSQQMIIDFQSGKQLITDNIVPMPRIWTISAYIGSATIANALSGQAFSENGKDYNPLVELRNMSSQDAITIPGLEPTIFFMPSLKLQHDIIENAWKNFKLVWFQDKYKAQIPVAIENLDFESDPAIQNKLIINVTLKEVITYNNANTPNLVTGSATIANDITNPASTSVNIGGASAVPSSGPVQVYGGVGNV